MKKLSALTLIVLGSFSLFGQNTVNSTLDKSTAASFTSTLENVKQYQYNSNHRNQFSNFNVNCRENFWTITSDGYIQQWSLSNGVISGGDTILSGGGTSIAFCGTANSPTFYSNDWTQVGIKYYDMDSGWMTIPTPVVVDHGGGHLNDLYYRSEGAVIQIIKYWDGINLTSVDSFNGEFFAGTQDIAVDTMGQAWVFTGFSPSVVDSLKVYDRNGRLNAYSFQNSTIAYGSFFLNDTLYVGSVLDSIYPVIISGTSAQFGDAIFFPPGSYTDMASCQESESINSIPELITADFNVFPNPTNGQLVLPPNSKDSKVLVYNIQGQLINFKLYNNTLDLSKEASGIYYIKISNKVGKKFYKVILY